MHAIRGAIALPIMPPRKSNDVRQPNKPRKTPWVRWLVLGLVVLLVLTLWAANWLWLDRLLGSSGDPNDPRYGLFGDRFGAVNALFSGLAFAGVIFAIWLQRDELILQREANEATRAELEDQNEYNARREFQTTFFDMLRALQDAVRLIAIDNQPRFDPDNPPAYPQPNRWVHGRVALEIMSDRLKSHIEDGLMRDKVNDSDPEALLNGIDNVYTSFYMRYGARLGHYFRMMYQIARHIRDEAEKSQTDPQPFVRILRAQLSQPEMVLLFYNCLSIHGYEKFHPLVESYDLLQNMERSSVPIRQWDLYPVTRDGAPAADARLKLNSRAQRIAVGSAEESIHAGER